MRLPDPDKSEVFTMRISKKHKKQLEELAKKGRHGKNGSEVIRYLIDIVTYQTPKSNSKFSLREVGFCFPLVSFLTVFHENRIIDLNFSLL